MVIARRMNGRFLPIVLFIAAVASSSTLRAQEFADDDEPAVAEEPPPIVIRNVAGALVAIPTHAQLHESLTWKIEDVDEACRLTDDQKKKLHLAGQGDITRFLHRIDDLRKKSLSEQANAQLEDLLRESESLNRLLTAGLFEEHSLFVKTLRRFLVAEQLARLEVDATLSSPTWIDDFREAQDLALKLDRPLVVYFQAKWCGPCQQMGRVLKAPRVLRALRGKFIAVSIDVDHAGAKPLLRHYDINEIPSVLVLNADAVVVHRSKGLKSEHEFLGILHSTRGGSATH